MAKRMSLQGVAEHKAGECRALATAMRAEAAALPGRRRHERTLMEHWAAALDEIGHGLTRAAADGDRTGFRLFGAAAASLTIGLVSGAAAGASQEGAARLFESESVAECAAAVLDGLDDLEALAMVPESLTLNVNSVSIESHAASPSLIVGAGAVNLEPATGEAHGAVTWAAAETATARVEVGSPFVSPTYYPTTVSRPDDEGEPIGPSTRPTPPRVPGDHDD